MPETYGLSCPVARTLDIIGERWSVLILRDLFLQGPRKFQDFESSLSGISPNTLSARLKRLEESGVIERSFYAEHPPRFPDRRHRLAAFRNRGQRGVQVMTGRQSNCRARTEGATLRRHKSFIADP